jgi:probable F420-dependent oxidoreductase
MTPDIGSVGVWLAPRSWRALDLAKLVAELEELGYGTFWMGGSPAVDLREPERLLDATSRIVVATGIVNVWSGTPEDLAESYQRVVAKHPERFVLGLGAGHREPPARPYDELVRFLDVFDSHNVPWERRMLAALGPRVLTLAARRTAGAHPYLTTPEHTRRARELIGPDRVLAPEQKVLLETQPGPARRRAREAIGMYLGLPNYVNHLRRLGYTEEALSDGGSDRRRPRVPSGPERAPHRDLPGAGQAVISTPRQNATWSLMCAASSLGVG